MSKERYPVGVGFLDDKGLAMEEKYRDYDDGFMDGVQAGIDMFYKELIRVKFSRLKAQELKKQMCSEQGRVLLNALCKVVNKSRAEYGE